MARVIRVPPLIDSATRDTQRAPTAAAAHVPANADAETLVFELEGVELEQETIAEPVTESARRTALAIASLLTTADAEVRTCGALPRTPYLRQ